MKLARVLFLSALTLSATSAARADIKCSSTGNGPPTCVDDGKPLLVKSQSTLPQQPAATTVQQLPCQSKTNPKCNPPASP